MLDDGSHLVVSNRFACLVQWMKERGIRRRANCDAVVSGLYSRHHFFRQIHTHALPIEGTDLVPVDQYLEIHRGRLLSHPKRSLTAALTGADERCDRELLDEGAAEVAAGVRAAVESPLFRRRWIELSGGFDSRLTLAAAVRIGALDRLQTVIRDVEGIDDLPVALDLARPPP